MKSLNGLKKQSSLRQLNVVMSGELLQNKLVPNWFSWDTQWEKHFFTLTNMGLMKFENGDFKRPPIFIPLSGLRMEIAEETSKLGENARKIKLRYEQASELKLLSIPREVILTHKDPVIFTTWVRAIREAILDKTANGPKTAVHEHRFRRDQLNTIKSSIGVRDKASTQLLQYSSGLANYKSIGTSKQ